MDQSISGSGKILQIDESKFGSASITVGNISEGNEYLVETKEA